jgi:hypothetical protein
MKTTKLAKRLRERVADLERALDRGLQVHGVCLSVQQGLGYCSDKPGGLTDLRQGCYVCHMRTALEDRES